MIRTKARVIADLPSQTTARQGLGVIIADRASGEALLDRAEQVVETGQRARAVNSGGHTFPFGR